MRTCSVIQRLPQAVRADEVRRIQHHQHARFRDDHAGDGLDLSAAVQRGRFLDLIGGIAVHVADGIHKEAHHHAVDLHIDDARLLVVRTAGDAQTGPQADHRDDQTAQIDHAFHLLPGARDARHVLRQEDLPHFEDIYAEKLTVKIEGAELENILKEIIAQVGAKTPADMGKVMGVATKKLAGQADGRTISETVKRLLS